MLEHDVGDHDNRHGYDSLLQQLFKRREKHDKHENENSRRDEISGRLEGNDVDEDGQDKAVLIIKQGLVDHSFVADPEINLASVMIKLARLQNED